MSTASDNSSTSSSEAEEIIREFPPPAPRLRWLGLMTSRSHPVGRSSWMQAPISRRSGAYRYISSDSKANVEIAAHEISQLDGHDDVKSRAKRAAKNVKDDLLSPLKHICGRCGRQRSRTYHKEHPIEPGKHPRPGICDRCKAPSGSTRAPQGSKTVIDETVEELLIMRKAGKRTSTGFQPRTTRAEPESDEEHARPRPQLERRHSDSSGMQVNANIEHDGARGCATECADCGSQRLRVQVRSRSRIRNLQPLEKSQEAPAPHRVIRYRLISPDRSSTKSRNVNAGREDAQDGSRARRNTEPPRPQPPAGPPSEWYFRRVTRVVDPDEHSSFMDGRRGAETQAPGASRQRPPARDNERRTRPNDPIQARHQPHSDAGSALFPHGTRDGRGAYDMCGTEWDNGQRRRRLRTSSSDGDYQKRRVHFAPGTRAHNGRAQRNRDECVRDWNEERHDKADFKHAKERAGAAARKGGGKYELFDLDGHVSDDEPHMPKSDSSQDAAGEEEPQMPDSEPQHFQPLIETRHADVVDPRGSRARQAVDEWAAETEELPNRSRRGRFAAALNRAWGRG